MRIGGWQRCSFVDYPGELACVLFTQGCDLRCPWCHNPDLLGAAVATSGLPGIDTVYAFLEHRQGRLTGVVITGGEPTLQGDLLQVLEHIRLLGYKVKLDSNGCRPAMLRRAIEAGLVDYLAIDVKVPPVEYRRLSASGRDPSAALQESIALVGGSDLPHEFRTTLVDGWHSGSVLRRLAEYIPPASPWFLQDLRTERMLQPDAGLRPVAPERARRWAAGLQAAGWDCRLRSFGKTGELSTS